VVFKYFFMDYALSSHCQAVSFRTNRDTKYAIKFPAHFWPKNFIFEIIYL
jgi:hypothetical protein